MSHISCLGVENHRLVGDPVDTLTGAVFDRTLEFRLTGPLELWWYRHYDSSQNQRQFAHGWGHTHDFDRVLRLYEDGITYEAPVGQIFQFPPLVNDGDEHVLHGLILRRRSATRYELFQHGNPAMEFEFHKPHLPARPKRLFKGKHQILFRYNTAGRLDRIVDSAGRSIIVVEEAHGRLISLTLEGGQGIPGLLLIAYHYDEHGNLIATNNSLGHGRAFAYDEANRMLVRRGRRGFKFRFTYDQQGRCVQATDDGGLYGVKLNFKVPGRLTEVTRTDGGVWTYYFEKNRFLSRIVDPLGETQKFIQNERGQTALEVDSNENITRIIYDAAGAPTAKIDPLSHRVSLPEDPNTSDPFAHRVAANPAEYEYGRLLDVNKITLPGRRQLQELQLSVEARSLVFEAERQQQSLCLKNQFNVNPIGFLWWPKPKYGRIFNDFGKLGQQYDEFGRQRLWTYDASGNLANYIDFDGGEWSYDYGSWHLLRKFTDPLSNEVRFSYTMNGQIASCVDAGGTSSEYRYDLKDNLVEVRRHGVVRETYTRDAVGNLVAKRGSDGRELLRFEIGPGNLPIRRSLRSGDEHTFQYDKSGRYLVATTKKDRVEFAYDILGNRILDKRNGLGVQHRFQGWRRPAESVFFDQFTVRYEWRTTDHLIITDPGGKSHEIRFLGDGLLKRCFSNGSHEISQYDNLGRCLFKCAHRRIGQVWSRRYHWSGEGELRRVKDNMLGEVRHEYDAAHRLRRRIVNGRVENYEMDLADNLLAQPGLDGIKLKEGNRLKYANGFSFEYNDRNHIAVRQSFDCRISYIYDSRDQLVRVERSEGIWEAEYDARGRRTRKTWAGRTTQYYWNDDQLVAEVSADGRMRLYIYADQLALIPLMLIDYDSIKASPESGRRYFVFTDQIGTPCLVEDENGTQVWGGQIEPFGQAQIDSGAKIEFSLRFPGHYVDAELGLHYNRFRYYDPVLGRYLQSDPWGLRGGYNVYAYRLNPLLTADVRGLGDEENTSVKAQEDEECPPRRPGDGDGDGNEGLPPLTREQGQEVVDNIHGTLDEKRIGQSVTTLSETEDGTLIVTNSDSVRPEMRNEIERMQQPGELLEGRNVIANGNVRGDPDYIPPAQRDLPDAPNPDRAGDGEQRGVQAANIYNERGGDNGEVTRQWSSGGAEHGGAACRDCETVQRRSGITNETGYQSQGGRYDRGGQEPDWNGVADPDYEPPPTD